MPGSAGSSWYFLRYIDPDNEEVFADQELLKHWMPIDLYIGGPEHAVGHLMYSRIWNNYLYDKGLSPVKEPFKKLVHQGMILGENGIKMGKRFPEYVVNPSDGLAVTPLLVKFVASFSPNSVSEPLRVDKSFTISFSPIDLYNLSLVQ